MRVLALLLALYHGTNGLVMLLAPSFWYTVVPGVDATGPLNTHFVRDTGLAFLACAAAFAIFAQSRGSRYILFPALVFLGGHATMHLIGFVHSPRPGLILIESMTVILPGLLPIILIVDAYRRKA